LFHAGNASQPRHDSVQVHGVWVHYFVAGIGAPIVHLPGGPGMSHVTLLPLVDLMAPLPYQNIIIDFRGVGASQAPLTAEHIGYDNIVEDIEAVRSKLHIKKWIVSGHSAGGQFAMYYTVKHPAAVEKLILISSVDADNAFQSYFVHNVSSRLTPEARAQMAKYRQPDEVKKDSMQAECEGMKTLFTAYFYDYKKAKAFIDTISQATYFAMNSTPYFNAFTYSEEYTRFNINRQLKNIKVPTLIIEGRQDPLGAEIPIRLQERIPGARLRFIDECGHLPWVEQPKTLLNILAAFLL